MEESSEVESRFKDRVAQAISELMDSLPSGTPKTEVADKIGIKQHVFQAISTGDNVTAPEVYFKLYQLTGNQAFDPRTLPPRTYVSRGVLTMVDRAWTEEEFQRQLKIWQETNAGKENPLKALATEQTHRPKADLPVISLSDSTSREDRSARMVLRPKVNDQSEKPDTHSPDSQGIPAFSSPTRAKRVSQTPPVLDVQALTDAFVRIIQVATWPLNERLMAIEQQLQLGENPVPQAVPKPATQPSPAIKGRDPSVVISELLAILRPLKSGSVEERDRFAEEYRSELIELVMLADPLTRSKEARERELASNVEVKIQ